MPRRQFLPLMRCGSWRGVEVKEAIWKHGDLEKGNLEAHAIKRVAAGANEKVLGF